MAVIDLTICESGRYLINIAIHKIDDQCLFQDDSLSIRDRQTDSHLLSKTLVRPPSLSALEVGCPLSPIVILSIVLHQ